VPRIYARLFGAPMPEELEDEFTDIDTDDLGEDEDGYPLKMDYESWFEKYGEQ
jgi:hypothetical protein